MKKLIQISLTGLFTVGFAIVGFFLLNNSTTKPNYSESLFEIKNNHGTYKEYYGNGKIKSVDTYTNGKRDGVSLSFSISGDTISSTNYKNGYKDGNAKTYDSSGDLIKVKSYSSGFLISEDIKNDSIYKYDVLSYETGSTLYTSECKSCHTTNSLHNITLSNLDSVHIALQDSGIIDSSAFVQLSPVDLNTISSYISELDKETKNKSIPLLVFRKKYFKSI